MRLITVRKFVGALALSLGLLGLTFSAQAAPTFVNAAAPDLPEQARGVPMGGALHVHKLALDQYKTVNLELERFSVFAPDATIEVVGGPSVPAPKVAYFRGALDSDQDAVVMMAVSESGSMRGMVTNLSGAWLLQGKKGNAKGLQNRKVDVASESEGRTFECGAGELPVSPEQAATSLSQTSGVAASIGIPVDVRHTANMVVDTDYEYWKEFYDAMPGATPFEVAAAALEYMGDIFAYSSSVYEREINTNLLIIHSRLWTTNTDPYEDNLCCDNPDGALYELRGEWGGEAPSDRTLVHLLSPRLTGSGGRCGCAFVGGLCENGGSTGQGGYGVSMGMALDFDIDSPAVLWDSTVVSHEIGHNFNSPHTHDYCGIENSDPVDQCVNDANNGNCPTSGVTTDYPGPGSLTGGASGDGNGTIMSYCHQRTGGFTNVSNTFGLYHPDGVAPHRVPNRMLDHVLDQSESCMPLAYAGVDLQVVKDCKPDDPMLVGDIGICTIKVTNVGTHAALNVTAVDDYLSDGTFEFGDVTLTKGDNTWVNPDACTATANLQVQSGSVSCDLGLIDVGHSATIKIEVTADTPQNINDLVNVYSDSPDVNLANNAAEDELNVVATSADLRVLKDCKPDTGLLAGETATCTILVANLGPDIAENVELRDTHSSDGSFTLNTSTPGCLVSSNVVVCDLGDIVPAPESGYEKTVVLTLTSDDDVDVTNFASAASDTPDPDNSNNTASDGVQFGEHHADLRVLKECKPDDPLGIGETAICTIFVDNLGPQTALNTVLTDVHMSDVPFTIKEVTGTGCPIIPIEGVLSDSNNRYAITCNLGSMNNGERETITVKLTSQQPGNVNDTATVISSTADPDVSNNDASDGVTFVIPLVDLVVSKVCKPDSPYVIGSGDPTPYCDITVQNLGQATATDVVLRDEIISLKAHQVVDIIEEIGYLDGECKSSSSADGTATTITCDRDTGMLLAPNISAKVRVVFDALEPVEVNDTASATTTANDTDPNNNGGNNPEAQDTVAFIENADVSVSKVCTPPEPQLPGVNATCKITVVNNGPSRAHAVTLQDKLLSTAPNPEFVIVDVWEDTTSFGNQASFLVNCTPSSGNTTVSVPEYDIECAIDVGDNYLEAGDRFEIEVAVVASDPIVINDIATVSSTTPDSVLDNNTANGQVSFAGNADLGIEKTVSADSVIAGGDSFEYSVVVTNYGPSMAHNVVITDQVPAGLSIELVESSGGTCVTGVAGSTPTVCTFDTMLVGEGETMTITVKALPDTRGLLSNDASVASDTLDGNNANDRGTVNVTVNGEADMAVGKTTTSDAVVAGALVDYTVTVTNNGPSTATGITLVDVLDGDQDGGIPGDGSDEGGLLTFVSAKDASDNDICTHNPTTSTLTCDLGTLQPLESFDVFITALVDPAAVGETIDNDATVSANEADPDTENNHDDVQDDAVEGADLWIDKTGNFPTGNPSGTILYYLTVYNREGCSEDDPQVCGTGGPSDALDVVVVDTLPSTAKKLPVEFVSENCSYDKGAHEVTCMEPVLKVGDSVTFEIQVRAKGGLGEITNTATVDSTTLDPDLSNNTDDLLMTVKGGTGDSGGPGGGRGRGGGKK